MTGRSNGLGAAFMPVWMRRCLTWLSDSIFPSEPHVRHDRRYAMGGSELDRLRADVSFLAEMLDDLAGSALAIKVVGAPLALFWFLCVLLFGWVASFRYGEKQ